MLPYVINAILLVLLAIASYTDIRYRRIRNSVTVPAVLLGLGLNALQGGPRGLLSSAEGLGFAFGLLLIPWMLGIFGGGDAKLLMAVGALIGWPLILSAAWYGAIAGGFLAVALILRRRSVLTTLGYVISPVAGTISIFSPGLGARLAAPGKPQVLTATLPAGFGIAIGTVAALLIDLAAR